MIINNIRFGTIWVEDTDFSNPLEWVTFEIKLYDWQEPIKDRYTADDIFKIKIVNDQIITQFNEYTQDEIFEAMQTDNLRICYSDYIYVRPDLGMIKCLDDTFNFLMYPLEITI